MPQFINVADLDSGNGKTYREINLATIHKYEVGSLVQILSTGVRLFIVMHTRDCDGTPLYSLSHDIDGIKWVSGYSEDSLKLIGIKVASKRQYLGVGVGQVRKLGIYINSGSGNLFHAYCTGNTATNRIMPEKVWLDDIGLICVEMKYPYEFPN